MIYHQYSLVSKIRNQLFHDTNTSDPTPNDFHDPKSSSLKSKDSDQILPKFYVLSSSIVPAIEHFNSNYFSSPQVLRKSGRCRRAPE